MQVQSSNGEAFGADIPDDKIAFKLREFDLYLSVSPGNVDCDCYLEQYFYDTFSSFVNAERTKPVNLTMLCCKMTHFEMTSESSSSLI